MLHPSHQSFLLAVIVLGAGLGPRTGTRAEDGRPEVLGERRLQGAELHGGVAKDAPLAHQLEQHRSRAAPQQAAQCTHYCGRVGTTQREPRSRRSGESRSNRDQPSLANRLASRSVRPCSARPAHTTLDPVTQTHNLLSAQGVRSARSSRGAGGKARTHRPRTLRRVREVLDGGAHLRRRAREHGGDLPVDVCDVRERRRHAVHGAPRRGRRGGAHRRGRLAVWIAARFASLPHFDRAPCWAAPASGRAVQSWTSRTRGRRRCRTASCWTRAR